MSQQDDTIGDALERLEWSDEKSGDVPKITQITRRVALTGGAAGLTAALLDACGGSGGGTKTNANARSRGISSIFGVSGGYRFTFVNHATSNTFFTPTISGAADACMLLGCSYEWAGSASSNVAQMVTAFNTAVIAGVDGIATSLIAQGAFAKPIAAATGARIPVVAYNADEPGTGRLAYIGQDLLRSGQEMGLKIKSLLPTGGRIMVFIATPGTGNLAPRLSGIQQVLKGSNLHVHSQASGAAESQASTTIGNVVADHLDAYQGYFAVDGASTAALAQAIQTNNLQGKVVAGGFDLIPTTETLLASSYLQFTIDQQPYLQGFLPVLELFLHNASQGLTGAADVDTGIAFLDSTTIGPYAGSTSRYEGSATTPGVQKA
jgi:simple sugar transport system substrate-binding protein